MSNTVAISNPHQGYDLVGAAGIWETMPAYFDEASAAMDVLAGIDLPEDETPDAALALTEEQEAAMATLTEFAMTPPYPYLKLLRNQFPATIDKPAYLFLLALTTTPDEPLIPVDEQAEDDMLHMTVEENRVMG